MGISGDLKAGVTWEHINMGHLATQLSQRDTWLVFFNPVYYFDCCIMKDSHADLGWDSWVWSLHPSSSPPESLPTVHFLHHRCQSGPWMSRASTPWYPSHTGLHGGFCWPFWERKDYRHAWRLPRLLVRDLRKSIYFCMYIRIFMYICIFMYCIYLFSIGTICLTLNNLLVHTVPVMTTLTHLHKSNYSKA